MTRTDKTVILFLPFSLNSWFQTRGHGTKTFQNMRLSVQSSERSWLERVMGRFPTSGGGLYVCPPKVRTSIGRFYVFRLRKGSNYWTGRGHRTIAYPGRGYVLLSFPSPSTAGKMSARQFTWDQWNLAGSKNKNPKINVQKTLGIPGSFSILKASRFTVRQRRKLHVELLTPHLGHIVIWPAVS